MCMCVEYMVANQILLCSLKTYLSLEAWKYFCERTGAILFISFFFRWASEYPLFSISQTLVHFFMNNFCIATCLFSAQNFWEIATRTWSIYLVDILSSIFLVFTQNVGVKHFWVDLDRMACFCAYPQCWSSAYLDGVYMILILRAWQASHRINKAWLNSI